MKHKHTTHKSFPRKNHVPPTHHLLNDGGTLRGGTFGLCRLEGVRMVKYYFSNNISSGWPARTGLWQRLVEPHISPRTYILVHLWWPFVWGGSRGACICMVLVFVTLCGDLIGSTSLELFEIGFSIILLKSWVVFL